MSREAGLWDRLVNDKWPQPVPLPTEAEAIAGARRLFRKATGRAWRGRVRIASGNRHTWVRRGVLYVNPTYRWRPGWPGIVHGIAHYAHYLKHPDDPPHSDRQAYTERDLVDYVLAQGWLDGKLKRPATTKPKRDPVKDRYQRILAREKTWESKLKRAENALAKVRRERREYERRHGDRILA